MRKYKLTFENHDVSNYYDFPEDMLAPGDLVEFDEQPNMQLTISEVDHVLGVVKLREELRYRDASQLPWVNITTIFPGTYAIQFADHTLNLINEEKMSSSQLIHWRKQANEKGFHLSAHGNYRIANFTWLLSAAQKRAFGAILQTICTDLASTPSPYFKEPTNKTQLRTYEYEAQLVLPTEPTYESMGYDRPPLPPIPTTVEVAPAKVKHPAFKPTPIPLPPLKHILLCLVVLPAAFLTRREGIIAVGRGANKLIHRAGRKIAGLGHAAMQNIRKLAPVSVAKTEYTVYQSARGNHYGINDVPEEIADATHNVLHLMGM